MTSTTKASCLYVTQLLWRQREKVPTFPFDLTAKRSHPRTSDQIATWSRTWGADFKRSLASLGYTMTTTDTLWFMIGLVNYSSGISFNLYEPPWGFFLQQGNSKVTQKHQTSTKTWKVIRHWAEHTVHWKSIRCPAQHLYPFVSEVPKRIKKKKSCILIQFYTSAKSWKGEQRYWCFLTALNVQKFKLPVDTGRKRFIKYWMMMMYFL